MKYLFSIIILLAGITFAAHGHGSGQTLEKIIGDIVIDMDYDSYSQEIDAQTATRFNFNIWNKDRTEMLEFTDVWVRIAPQEQGIVFAGDMHNPEFGATGFTYTFPKPGFYEVTIRFQKQGESLHEEVMFPLTVAMGETQSSSGGLRTTVVGIGLGIVIGLAIAFFLKKWFNF